MLEKEKLLKEQRTALAVDKNYMGLDGKFGIILKQLGTPILFQGAKYFQSTEWKDVYEDVYDPEMPELDEDTQVKEIGKLFDGLKFGYHIEISYLKVGTIPIKWNEYRTTYEEAFKVLKVAYKGYLVYLEAEGDLHIFTPQAEWEDLVQRIYESAEKVKKSRRLDLAFNAAIEDKKEKLGFLQKLREAWGI